MFLRTVKLDENKEQLYPSISFLCAVLARLNYWKNLQFILKVDVLVSNLERELSSHLVSKVKIKLSFVPQVQADYFNYRQSVFEDFRIIYN
jgi:hypothetical protein